MTRRIRRGGNSEDFQLMFLGDVDANNFGEDIVTGEGFVWDETQEKFVHTALATQAGVAPSLGLFNVKDYGALGDSASDDTASIQDALDAAGVSGGEVTFPGGTYLISDILYYYSNTILSGHGQSQIKNTNTRDSYIMLLPDPNSLVTNVLIDGLTFDQRGDLYGFTSSDQLLSINEVSGITIRNCVFKNVITMAIWADTKTADETTQHVPIDGCRIEAKRGWRCQRIRRRARYEDRELRD